MMSYLIGEISDITLLAPPFNLQETEAEYRGWIDRGARVTRWPGVNRYTGVLEFILRGIPDLVMGAITGSLQ